MRFLFKTQLKSLNYLSCICWSSSRNSTTSLFWRSIKNTEFSKSFRHEHCNNIREIAKQFQVRPKNYMNTNNYGCNDRLSNKYCWKSMEHFLRWIRREWKKHFCAPIIQFNRHFITFLKYKLYLIFNIVFCCCFDV